MPVNTTVSHVSPLLLYVPQSAWYEGSQSDPNLMNYSNASYHATNATSGSAGVTFSWWGTGVWVYGGHRTTSGEYQVILDGQNSTDYSGYTDGPEAFQQLLFNASGLACASHQIRIVNTSQDPARPIFDIDYLVFESPQEEASLVEHTNPGYSWLPDNSENTWSVNDVSHTTNDSFGAMELNFTGSGIAVYGNMSGNSAPVSVSIDGWSSRPLTPNTAITPLVDIPQLLFAKTDMGDGQHTLRVENNPMTAQATKTEMDIAFCMVLRSSTSQGGDPLLPPTGPGLSDSASHHRTVVLAACFSTLGTFLLGILVWRVCVHFRQKSRRQRDLVTTRPFFARKDPYGLSPTSPDASSSWPEHAGSSRSRTRTRTRDAPGASTSARYTRAHTDSISLGGGDQGSSLQRSLARMVRTRRHRPASISYPARSKAEEAAAERAAYEYAEEHERLTGHRRGQSSVSSDGSSFLMYQSMYVNAPPSLDGEVGGAFAAAGAGTESSPWATLPPRGRRPRSIDKPPLPPTRPWTSRLPLMNVGSPVGTVGTSTPTPTQTPTPSSSWMPPSMLRGVRSLPPVRARGLPIVPSPFSAGAGGRPLPPRPLPPPPPALHAYMPVPMRSPPGAGPYEFDIMPAPPPYRLLDTH